MEYGIYPVTAGGETICPPCARRSVDAALWICNLPQNAPQGIEPLQTLTYEQARALMDTDDWSGDAL